ncbi:MAG: hypothetical protein PHR35_03415 [Kiritimatiellae bacterium]|nr:hypothetical protein [Kiritimatiellia bacterium]
MAAAMRQWVRVTRQEPCAICHKPDWCTFTSDGQFACCMRVESARRVRNGGWLHRLAAAPAEVGRTLPPPCDRKLALDCGAYHAALRRRWDWRWCDGFSLDLGVDMAALEALEPAYDGVNEAFAFPMRNGDGGVCGIRLRARNGRKWSVRGSCEGLFFERDLSVRDDLVVCEGPTDTAAALTLGLCAVGRPSCSGGNDALAALVRRLGVRRVTLVADHDAPHRRPDGSVWYPGRDGAAAMARALRRAWRMVMPPAKNLRAWLHEGATREQFDALAASATWRLG